MKPDKKNYQFLVSELKSFGFKFKKKFESLLEEEVSITEIQSTYCRNEETIVLTRIKVTDKSNEFKDIGLYLTISTPEFEKEIFEIEDFIDYFRNEIRDVKISKIIE